MTGNHFITNRVVPERNRPGDSSVEFCLCCDGMAGSLASHCPGRKLTYWERQEIVSGRLDFIRGSWILNRQSTYSAKYEVILTYTNSRLGLGGDYKVSSKEFKVGDES